MSSRIDLYGHYLPESFLKESYEYHPAAVMKSLQDAPHFWDVKERLANMDDFGVDRQAIMLTQHNWPNLDPKDAVDLARVGNQKILEVAEEHPDRFVPVATIPYVDSYGLEAVDDWLADGFAGVQLFSNQRGKPVDDENFMPLYETMERNDAPIWLHPQTHAWHEWSNEYVLNKMFGWPFETTLAMARLVFGGVLEQYPGLDVITHHTGGMVPFYRNRIKAYWEKEENVGWADLSDLIESYFQRFYADTMIHGSVESLHAGLDFFGADNLVFGTDYPFGPSHGRNYMDITTSGVDAMDISSDTREKIYHRNAKRLLND